MSEPSQIILPEKNEGGNRINDRNYYINPRPDFRSEGCGDIKAASLHSSPMESTRSVPPGDNRTPDVYHTARPGQLNQTAGMQRVNQDIIYSGLLRHRMAY